MKTSLLLASLLTASSALAAINPSPSRELSFSTSCSNASSSAVISFNGDILVHHSIYADYVIPKKSFAAVWKPVEGLLKKADFSVANLEGPAALGIDASGRDRGDVGFIYDARYYGPEHKRTKEDDAYDSRVIYSGTNMVFNFHPRILSDLKNSGYDLLTIANNHALDRFSVGIDSTIAAARAVGIPTAGARIATETRTERYHYTVINGIRIAFISCTEELNGRRDSKDQVLMCMRDDKVETMVSNLSKHPDVDAVVVLPHWGIEYNTSESKAQSIYAKKWLDAGASAVVGSHPHVLQPWEKYLTTDGRETVVMYSLGNFVASQRGVERKTGVVTYLGFSKTGDRTRVSAIGYTPTYRETYTVDPITNPKSVEGMSEILQRNFGVQNRIVPASALPSRFCK